MSANRRSRKTADRPPVSRHIPAAIALCVVATGMFMLPDTAQSQISSRNISAPDFSITKHSAAPATPKGPAQVEMPAPPPIKYFAGLDEPLVATGDVGEQENKDLNTALAAFHDAPAKTGENSDYADYAAPLIAFMDTHPTSNWRAAILTNLGFGYYRAGYYSRAFVALHGAWQLGRDAKTPQAHIMIDRAVGELARMHARVGHDSELTALFADIGKRPIGGPGTETIQAAHEGLWMFHNHPELSYLCGPAALKNVLIALKGTRKQIKVAEDARSGEHGFSLTELAALSDKAKLKYTLIKRTPGQPIPVPSIVNWNVHHYAAITGTLGSDYTLIDPTFGGTGTNTVSAKAIDAESSGYFLVPASVMKANARAGWRVVSAHSNEAKAIYGMGIAGGAQAGSCIGCDGQAGSPMTTASANNIIVSLRLTDTPVGYAPQKGLPVYTGLTYNQREDMQPATMSFSNVSPKWAFSWQGYIQDDPVHAGMSVTRYASGGGGYAFIGFNTSTGSFSQETPDFSQLFRIPVSGAVTSYERRMRDGSKEVYGLTDGATTAPRRIFLTQLVDAAGNTTTLSYDASFRVTSVTDAMGRSTSFTYGLPLFPLLITQITDPFGRTSQLTYDASTRLASITDPVGITSSFTYSTTEPTFITQLTTPYGTSTYNDTPNPNDTVETDTRSLTLTDPLGFTDFLYFYQNSTIVPANTPAGTLPANFSNTDNGFLQWRNTFHWDPHAFALGVTMSGGVVQSEDFTKAEILHWGHDIYTGLNTGLELFSQKKPLENRIWFNYMSKGITSGGAFDSPIGVGRVMDNGSSQETIASYNAMGNITRIQPPSSGFTNYSYAANNIDMTGAVQFGAGPAGILAGFGSYTSFHKPQTFTDTSGKVWHYTYTTAGQIATMTDPNSGVTTWNYDASGRLSTIVNANLATVLTLTYDSADRILTKTDSEGRTLTYAYDNIDRVTSVTYPDGTTDLNDYTFQSGPNVGTASLELRKHTDRLGRVTTYAYDADRRLTSVTEPVSGATTRTTSYSYYENGALKDITDANGNVTHYTIDIEGRPVTKTYAFGTASAQTETYAYETTMPRIHTVTDALGQVKTYSYTADNRLAGVSYTSTVNPTTNITFSYAATNTNLQVTYLLNNFTDATGTTHFTYVIPGVTGALPGAMKLATMTGPYTNDSVSLAYDTMGRLSSRTVAGGNEAFTYDAISRLATHTTPLGVFTYGYLGQTGQVASRSVTNGAVTTSTAWGYDTNANDRRLISITNSGVTRSYALSYLSGLTQNPYDIQSVTDTVAAGHPWATQTHAYSYDLRDRLLTANTTTPGNFAYGYDPLDNATAVTTPSGTVSPVPSYNALNQLATWGANTYAYDANGNTLSGDGSKTYKYDAEDRLIEIDYVGTSNKSVFTYDALGHRILDAETVSGTTTTTRYQWCPDTLALNNQPTGASMTQLNPPRLDLTGLNRGGVYDPRMDAGIAGSTICQTRTSADVVQRRDLDEGEYNVTTSQKLVYMPDQLGSVRDVIDATTGTRVASYDFTPYGAVARSSVTNGTDYQYAGLFAHTPSSINLAQMRAREPVTGRWLNRDPIREAGGPNMYAYVKANTINYLDPQGLGMVISKPMPVPIGQTIGRIVGPIAEGFGAGAEGIIYIFWPNETASPSDDEEPIIGSCPKPGDIEGKTPDEVDQIMKGKGWIPSPTNSQDGTRYNNPDVPGQQVRVMPGGPSSLPVKNGPYGVVSNGNGPPVRVPLAGNPTLSR